MEITATAIKRLVKDIKDITKNPLTDNGIYYEHCEENMLKGYALLIGPENTPYAYGNYFFEIDFPKDYPFNPPKFTFLTNNENIRMNPNLYRNGKVCISILNTWRGEQWSSCQTIKTILLTLLTIFNDKPLLNEPGFREDSNDFKPYNEIISFKNIDIAILQVLNNNICLNMYKKFKEHIDSNFSNNYKNIEKIIKKNKKQNGIIKTTIYNMNVEIDYNRLHLRLKNLIKN